MISILLPTLHLFLIDIVQSGTQKGEVSLHDVTDVALTKAYLKKENVFTVYTPSRPFYFSAPTLEEAGLWVEQITLKIPSKQGIKR